MSHMETIQIKPCNLTDTRMAHKIRIFMLITLRRIRVSINKGSNMKAEDPPKLFNE